MSYELLGRLNRHEFNVKMQDYVDFQRANGWVNMNRVVRPRGAGQRGDLAMFPDHVGFDPQQPRDLVKQGDDEAAVSYIKKFVERGSVRAMIAMADYLFDTGDKEGSLSWMDRVERSIADDDFVSPIYLSSAYKRGLGHGTPPERHQKAFAILERVAESGNVSVIQDMMSNYLNGLNGAPRDYERFIYWAKKAAALGSETVAQVLRDQGLSMPDGEASAF